MLIISITTLYVTRKRWIHVYVVPRLLLFFFSKCKSSFLDVTNIGIMVDVWMN
jgi:hypothetical protein